MKKEFGPEHASVTERSRDGQSTDYMIPLKLYQRDYALKG